jgi:hypothetical protein
MQFEEFSQIDDKQEFELCTNGYILRVSGRDNNDDWVNKSYIFKDETLFFTAIARLKELHK